MTTFKEPLYLGKDTGIASTSTKSPLTFVKVVRVSGGSHDTTVTIPDNCALLDAKAIQIQAATTAMTVNVGTTASPALYATITPVSASGAYVGTLKAASVSAAGEVVVQSTAVAGDYTAGKTNVNLIFVARA